MKPYSHSLRFRRAFCVVALIYVVGCGKYEPSVEEKNAIATVLNQGGLVKELGGGRLQINFTHMGVDDDGLKVVKPLTRMEMILLAGTEVTDAGMAHLAASTSLRQMSLKQTAIGDAGLEHLGGLTNLQELDLTNTKITDKGLAHLHGLTSLEKLYLDGTTVTIKGLRPLKEALPKLNIFGP